SPIDTAVGEASKAGCWGVQPPGAQRQHCVRQLPPGQDCRSTRAGSQEPPHSAAQRAWSASLYRSADEQSGSPGMPAGLRQQTCPAAQLDVLTQVPQESPLAPAAPPDGQHLLSTIRQSRFHGVQSYSPRLVRVQVLYQGPHTSSYPQKPQWLGSGGMGRGVGSGWGVGDGAGVGDGIGVGGAQV